MRFKVTGMIRNGRWRPDLDEWEIARITPRFFTSEQKARHFFESLEKGILWRRNKDGARNEYSVYYTLNLKWPEGARNAQKV